MYRDYRKFKRVGESRNISVIGVNGSLLLSELWSKVVYG